MSGIAVPRPRDPDAFLGRSSNVGTTGVMPAIERGGRSGSSTPTIGQIRNTFGLGTSESTGGGPTTSTVDTTFTATSAGLWLISWTGYGILNSDAATFALRFVIDGEDADLFVVNGWTASSARCPVGAFQITPLENGATVGGEITSPNVCDYLSLDAVGWRIPGTVPPR